jgi:hypothetical protein
VIRYIEPISPLAPEQVESARWGSKHREVYPTAWSNDGLKGSVVIYELANVIRRVGKVPPDGGIQGRLRVQVTPVHGLADLA